jgi:aarF domain-containing kinase
VLKELQKLCDSVRPIPDELALALIRQDLGHDNLSDLFGGVGEDGNNSQEHGLQLVASASLGQVYKARLRTTGDEVAIKVQRPGMRKNFSLDLFLLQQYGGMIDSFTSAFTMQKPFHRDLFDSYCKGSYSVSLSFLGGTLLVIQQRREAYPNVPFSSDICSSRLYFFVALYD